MEKRFTVYKMPPIHHRTPVQDPLLQPPASLGECLSRSSSHHHCALNSWTVRSRAGCGPHDHKVTSMSLADTAVAITHWLVSDLRLASLFIAKMWLLVPKSPSAGPSLSSRTIYHLLSTQWLFLSRLFFPIVFFSIGLCCLETH